jgi:hypothetical protein
MKKIGIFKQRSMLIVSAIFALSACEKTDPLLPTDKDGENWTIEVVDSIPGAEAGIYNMLACDVDSGIHIAYVVSENDYSLRYAYKPYQGNWSITEVANPISDDIIDIAVDNQKNVFIAYRGYDPSDNNNERMYIAEKSINGSFSSVMVDVMERNDQARYPAIYADKNDVIHISFERANYGMRYATYSFQGTFTPALTLDDDISGSNSDIVVASEGNKHILHFNNENIYYSQSGFSDNNWIVSQVATAEESNDSYAGISIAIDRFDNLHAAYRHSSYDNNIHYLFKASGSSNWLDQGIGNMGGSNRLDRSIACDTLGNPHVLYDEDYALKIASKKASWSYGHILGNSDYRCDTNYDIEITDKNRAHVSFYCRTTGVLLYASKQLK